MPLPTTATENSSDLPTDPLMASEKTEKTDKSIPMGAALACGKGIAVVVVAAITVIVIGYITKWHGLEAENIGRTQEEEEEIKSRGLIDLCGGSSAYAKWIKQCPTKKYTAH